MKQIVLLCMLICISSNIFTENAVAATWAGIKPEVLRNISTIEKHDGRKAQVEISQKENSLTLYKLDVYSSPGDAQSCKITKKELGIVTYIICCGKEENTDYWKYAVKSVYRSGKWKYYNDGTKIFVKENTGCGDVSITSCNDENDFFSKYNSNTCTKSNEIKYLHTTYSGSVKQFSNLSKNAVSMYFCPNGTWGGTYTYGRYCLDVADSFVNNDEDLSNEQKACLSQERKLKYTDTFEILPSSCNGKEIVFEKVSPGNVTNTLNTLDREYILGNAPGWKASGNDAVTHDPGEIRLIGGFFTFRNMVLIQNFNGTVDDSLTATLSGNTPPTATWQIQLNDR